MRNNTRSRHTKLLSCCAIVAVLLTLMVFCAFPVKSPEVRIEEEVIIFKSGGEFKTKFTETKNNAQKNLYKFEVYKSNRKVDEDISTTFLRYYTVI
jgi:hypothetical protein